jgi:hypothetical protein
MKPVNIDRINRRDANVQHDAQQSAGIDAGSADPAGLPSLPQSVGDGRANHDRRGRFVRGNLAAKTHGLHMAMPELMRAAGEAFFASALADDGDEPSTRRRSLIEYRTRLHSQICQVANALERFSIFDRRGKLRAVWIGKLESLINVALSIDKVLGLERRPKNAGALDGDAAGFLDAQHIHHADPNEE